MSSLPSKLDERLKYLDFPPTVLYVLEITTLILFYDHGLTLDREIRLIWKAPWNLAKALFIFIRYYTPLSIIVDIGVEFQTSMAPAKSCKINATLYIGSLTLIHASAHLLLFLRVYAIWKREAKVLIIMCPLLVAIFVSYGALFVEILVQKNRDARTCFATHATPTMYACWAAAVLFDVTGFTLSLTQAMLHWRKRVIRTPLLQVFYRDGLGYFGVLTALRIFNFVGSANGNLTGFATSTFFVRSLTVIFTTRMFLNLRSVNSHEGWASATRIRAPRKPQQDDSP